MELFSASHLFKIHESSEKIEISFDLKKKECILLEVKYKIECKAIKSQQTRVYVYVCLLTILMHDEAVQLQTKNKKLLSLMKSTPQPHAYEK